MILLINPELLLNPCETWCSEFERAQAKSEPNVLRLMLNYNTIPLYAERLAVRVTAGAYLMGITLQ